MTNTYTFRVGGDFNELIRGFQQLETQAQKAGNKVGQNLNDGIQGFSSRSLAALNQELNRLQQRQTKVAVDSTAFEKAGAKIRDIQALIAQVEKKRLLIGVDDKSITALQAKLQALQSKQTKIKVDSKEFDQLQREIGDTEKELQQINNRKLLINADPSSIIALQAKLQALQSELNRVQVGSQRFKELKTAIQATEDQLARAGEAVGDFRILDGVIQGVAFSLSNLVVDGAGRALSALQGLVAEYGRLDTEIRQAAAASGEAGAYDRLARTIDQVGIEAAGTTQDVARLATELSRGGMTVEQVAATMPGIVRGAEATGTAFDRMGSIVSASLKIFQLEVSSTARVVDALVTGANASATDVTGLGYALKYAGPPAKLLGISIEELTAAIGLLTNAGIEASEAGVTLRNGLSKLASSAPTASGGVGKLTGQAKMASDTMKQLGINIFEADGTLKPMQETLLTLKAAFDQLEPASRIRLAANLFGGEDDGTKWLALLGQTEDEIIKLTDTMSNAAGATDKARDAMQGFELKGKQLQGTLG